MRSVVIKNFEKRFLSFLRNYTPAFLEDVALFKFCYFWMTVDRAVLINQCVFLFVFAWKVMSIKTSWKTGKKKNL